MFVIKYALEQGHYSDDRGVWQIHQADGDVTFLGRHNLIEISKNHDFSEDGRFPFGDYFHLEYIFDCPDTRAVRWVRWEHNEASHVLITDGTVYICNESGKTIETIPYSKPPKKKTARNSQ